MKKTPSYKDLMQNAFSLQPAVKQDKPAALPPKPATVKPAPVTRDQFDPGTVGAVQAFVWKDGNPPPPKSPPAAMGEQGTAPSMKQPSGWGQV
jgi:hypothetical protein